MKPVMTSPSLPSSTIGTLFRSTSDMSFGVTPEHSLYRSGNLGAVAKLLATGTVIFVPSWVVISPTGFLRRFIPGFGLAHGMRSSVTILAGPWVMILFAGGSAFGSGNLEGGGDCCASAAHTSESAAATVASNVRARND